MIQNIYTSFDNEYKTKKTQNKQQTTDKNNKPQCSALSAEQTNKQQKKKRLSSLFNYLSDPRFLLCYHREDLILLTL